MLDMASCSVAHICITGRATLFRQLWAANSLDLILDFVLTLVSVVFNYTSPFFLKRILDAIDDKTPVARSQAYIYASLAFLFSMCKAQADVQHLWFGRRRFMTRHSSAKISLGS
ncbi:hypothetical protein BC827DRAFT_56924 [Russula dissimulans]|nr:hypothetical protein BC827DRAFT_56924 [Russula dissimulans]